MNTPQRSICILSEQLARKFSTATFYRTAVRLRFDPTSDLKIRNEHGHLIWLVINCHGNLTSWHWRNQKSPLRDRFPFRWKCDENSASTRARCWNGMRKATPWSYAKPAGIRRKTFIRQSLSNGDLFQEG